jgi:hypothetical protein
MMKTAIDSIKEAMAAARAIHLTVFCPGLGRRAITTIPITGRKTIQLNKFKFKAIYLSRIYTNRQL